MMLRPVYASIICSSAFTTRFSSPCSALSARGLPDRFELVEQRNHPLSSEEIEDTSEVRAITAPAIPVIAILDTAFVRSDNVCFSAGSARIVDWNWAARGNPRLDVAAWLPSFHAEGGPRPKRSCRTSHSSRHYSPVSSPRTRVCRTASSARACASFNGSNCRRRCCGPPARSDFRHQHGSVRQRGS